MTGHILVIILGVLLLIFNILAMRNRLKIAEYARKKGWRSRYVKGYIPPGEILFETILGLLCALYLIANGLFYLIKGI